MILECLQSHTSDLLIKVFFVSYLARLVYLSKFHLISKKLSFQALRRPPGFLCRNISNLYEPCFLDGVALTFNYYSLEQKKKSKQLPLDNYCPFKQFKGTICSGKGFLASAKPRFHQTAR